MLFRSILAVFFLFTACKDDVYNKVDDLFQPRFVLERPAVESNSIALVWYQVNDAESYTIELHQDTYYKSLFMELQTSNPYIFIDDIPYGTTFYIRVRSNAINEVNNSQWSYTTASTEARPDYAKIVEDVSSLNGHVGSNPTISAKKSSVSRGNRAMRYFFAVECGKSNTLT